MMQTPGVMLKRARLERGIDLDELARITRISRSTLYHIELDSYDELPAEVFVRGFIRNVARELGLGGESVIKAYEEHTGRVHRPAMEQLAQGKASRRHNIPQLHLIKRLKAQTGGGPKKSAIKDRAVEIIGSAKPSYVFGSLVVLLGIDLVVSVLTTNSIDLNPKPAGKASWDLKTDAPKARWILDGQSNLSGSKASGDSGSTVDKAAAKPKDTAAP